MTCGIYALDFEDSFYIGKSINIEVRYKEHFRHLIKGTHHSTKVLNAYNILKKLPELYILETVKDIPSLNYLEIQYIEEFDTFRNGLNATIGGEGTGYGELSPLSVNSNENIIKVFDLLVDNPKLSQKDISDMTGVSTATINKISSCHKHTWLEAEFPEKYAILRSMVGNRLALKNNYPNMLSPEGKIFEVSNIRAFAKEHNLDPGALCNVMKGKRKTVNKWKVNT